jgi:amino acid transporter
MTAICTNGEIGSGGFYFMISRSLGPETGAMFGILYFLTNAIMVAFSIIGVCEEIKFIFQV